MSTEPNTAPERVVTVVSAKAVRGYPYVVAAVYRLEPRKDGVLTYRKSSTGTPHRSVNLAEKEAVEMSEQLGIPFWRHVRHGTTADDAMTRHQNVPV